MLSALGVGLIALPSTETTRAKNCCHVSSLHFVTVFGQNHPA